MSRRRREHIDLGQQTLGFQLRIKGEGPPSAAAKSVTRHRKKIAKTRRGLWVF